VSDVKAISSELVSQWTALLTWLGVPSSLVLVSEPESATIDTSSPDAEARAIVRAKLGAKKIPEARVHVERWLAVDRDKAREGASREEIGPMVRELNLAHAIAARAGYAVPAKLPELAVLSEGATTLDDALRPFDVIEQAINAADAAARAPKARARKVLPLALGALAVAVVAGTIGYVRIVLGRAGR